MDNKTIILKKLKIKKKPLRVLSKENQNSKNIKVIKKLKTKMNIHRPTSALANQNMNNIAHLYKNNQNSKVDILWTLNLRNTNDIDSINEKYKKKRELMHHIKEPSFYQEDLEKYIKKRFKKSKSAFDINLPILNKYSYLFKNKITETHGTILNNKDLLNFELSLRKFNLKENKNINNTNTNNKYDEKQKVKKKNWNNNIYTDKRQDLYTTNYNVNLTNEKLKNNWLNEKLVNRPYKVVFKKIIYDDNNNIIKKSYIKDKEKAYNKLGDNYSYKQYNDKYNEKNYNNIENLLTGNNKSQQNVWFQLSLRNDFKKTISKKI